MNLEQRKVIRAEGQREILLLKVQNFFLFASMSIVVTFLPLYFKRLGLTSAEIGWILAVGPFVSIFSQPLWGIVADRIKSIRRTILCLVIGVSILSIGLFTVKTFLLILIFITGFMFFMSSMGPLTDTMNIYTARFHGMGYGSIRGWGSIGFSLASLCLGPIIVIVGLSNMVYLYLAFMLLVFSATFCLKEMQTSTTNLQFLHIQALFGSVSFLKFLLLVMLIGITQRLNDTWIGIYMTNLGASEQSVGTAWMIAAGSVSLVYMVASNRMENYHPLSLILFACILYTVRWILYSLIDSYLVLLLLQVFQGITFAIFFASSIRYISQLVPEQMRATGQGVFAAVFSGISGIVGSLSGGWIMEAYDGSVIFIFAAVISGITCIYTFVYKKAIVA